MEKKIFYADVPPKRFGFDLENPWNYAVSAYRVAPHVWQVGGQDDVCVYLLDSGEGLILIDTGYRASVYLLIDQIWRAGFDPGDVKIILLSHWHWDHVNGCRFIKEMSGAEVWMSKEDEVQHQLHKDETDILPMVDFNVDRFYDDANLVELGRFKIRTRLCPGHTPGATSFFFNDRDEETGVEYQCAMHGGLGVPFMKPEILAKLGFSEEMAHRFIRDSIELADWKVDIVLASHLNMGNVLPNIPKDRNDYHSFVADYAWGDILRDRARVVMSYYPDKYKNTR